MQVQIRTSFQRTARLIRNDRAFIRATRKMPRPVPWEWAEPRLMPLVASPRNDKPGEELVRASSDVGCAIEFGIDLGGHFPLVDRSVAERWEMSAEQLRAAATANLGRRAPAIPASAVRTAVRSGRVIRVLRHPVGCASSLLLAPQELRRLFGSHDQVFGAPGRHTLVSFPIDTPASTVAELHVEMEMDELVPLFLQPLALIDGRLVWSDTELDDEDGVD
jgi:hypothetical protein